ncbi:MAG: GNAT family N-acetyltransferase [Bacteroidota bacterium]|nr:GNAT family N-acetyltransferase [Bacteroidota bacterium]
MIEIIPYSAEHKEKWNDFIKSADNSNFLFNRDFMEYHNNRFTDCSVLLMDENVVCGVFPANRKENNVYSHQGLTYGGLILQERKNPRKLINYFNALFSYFQAQGIHEVYYKPIPNYISKTINDIEHFIFSELKAEVVKVDTSFVIDLKDELKFQERRRRSIKKGDKVNTRVEIDNDFEKFWNSVLIPNLRDKFGTKPIHSLEEINLLHSRFPSQILQANAYVNNEIAAGVTLMDFDGTVHCQYISSTDYGRDCGAIDFLFNNLINLYQPVKKYFSLGTANNDGNDINFGLSEWKEGWGAKIHAHFYYKVKIENSNNLVRFIS